MDIRYILLCCIAVIFFAGCTDSKYESTTLSGQIVNPKSSHIIIYKNHRLIDSVELNDENMFHYQFKDSIKKGLYTFQHNYDTHYETQVFYIEKGDSLQLRLNTRDFDKSLMYSGRGAVANNFLMTVFNDNRENSKMFLNYFRISPLEFKDRADSIQNYHLKELKQDYQAGEISKAFKNLAQLIVDYDYYNLHERYFFLVNKYNPNPEETLPDDFLAYRESIELNDRELQTYYIYQYFLDDYLKNISVERCLEASGSYNCYNLNSTENLKKRLHLADSLFELKNLRDRFFTQFGARLVVQSENKKEVDSILSFLKEAELNHEALSQIENLGNIQKQQFIGNVGHLDLTIPSGKKIEISSLLGKPTIFYYWSIFYTAHHINLHEKISQLRLKYLEVNFIGVNIDNDERDMWETSLGNFGYDQDFEYQLVCPPDERSFYRNYLNKLVFVAKSGEIINGNLDINDPRLEEKILGILNQ